MWQQYKKTFWAVQILTGAVSTAVYLKLGHNVIMATTFLLTMEVAGVLGAAWSNRLRGKLQAR